MTEQEKNKHVCELFENYSERSFADKVLAENNEIKNKVWEKIYHDTHGCPDLINSPYLEKYIIPLLVPIINRHKTGIHENERDFFKWEAISECILRFFEYDPYKKEGQVTNGVAFFNPIVLGVRSRILYTCKGYQTNTERFVDKSTLHSREEEEPDKSVDEIGYDIAYQKNKEYFKMIEDYQNEILYEEYAEILNDFLSDYTPSYAKKLAVAEFLRRHPELKQKC